MNMMGNLGGFVSPIVIGVILDKWGHNYAPSFYMNSAVFALGAICWIFIDPVTSMDDAAPSQAEAQPT
jgi:nitrate/nitrite transporter NarK